MLTEWKEGRKLLLSGMRKDSESARMRRKKEGVSSTLDKMRKTILLAMKVR